MEQKIIKLENAVLLNECVQKSGGIMYIIGSYTDEDGNTCVKVEFSHLNVVQRMNYNRTRIKGGIVNHV
jgi:hypothetical protein